jgi:hypothetical protein
MPIHGGICGFSRMGFYLTLSSDNTGECSEEFFGGSKLVAYVLERNGGAEILIFQLHRNFYQGSVKA